MYIIKDYKENTLEVKNSKFIGMAYYVDSEDDINNIIKNVKKKYFDAKHHCYAYKLGFENQIIKQFDDNEPKGTAGVPILNAINSSDITNCLFIVVRYFGGVLLGASLLLRTYADCALNVLSSIEKTLVIDGVSIDISLDYKFYSNFQNYVFSKLDYIYINKNDFLNNIFLTCYVSNEIKDEFIEKINDISSGKTDIIINNKIRFAKFKNEIRILDYYEQN